MSLSSLISRMLASSSVPAIEHDDLVKASQARECHIIDVREPHEYATGHIPGAENQPLSQFNPQALPNDKPVILVCQAGARSARALQQAISAGHQNIAHYAAGTSGWRARGGPIAM